VRVDDAEIDAIAAYLSIPVERFIDEFTCLTEDRRGLSLTERKDGSCVFYESDPSRCAINAVKPAQCRGFPLEWNFPGWEKLCAGSGRTAPSKGGGRR
jgi:Fe-S-cluster containining protein